MRRNDAVNRPTARAPAQVGFAAWKPDDESETSLQPENRVTRRGLRQALSILRRTEYE